MGHIFTDWIIFVAFTIFGKKRYGLGVKNPLNQELLRSGKVKLIKQLILKHFLFKLFIDKFLYIGSENKKFFEYYGVKEKSPLNFSHLILLTTIAYRKNISNFSLKEKLLKINLAFNRIKKTYYSQENIFPKNARWIYLKHLKTCLKTTIILLWWVKEN
jgi:hypothetical protein